MNEKTSLGAQKALAPELAYGSLRVKVREIHVEISDKEINSMKGQTN